MNDMILEIINVSKSVTNIINNRKVKIQILSNINLNVHYNENIIIFGMSGAGKTMLLRLINLLSNIDSGSIFFKGIDIRDYQPQKLRKKIGMVFQFPVMFQGSVRDNIEFAANLWNLPINIKSLADIVCIPYSLLDKDAEKLSGGEKQRVSIARTLATQPEILLLDEPTSFLDSDTEINLIKNILKLQKHKNLTIIWVTHKKELVNIINGKSFELKNGTLKNA